MEDKWIPVTVRPGMFSSEFQAELELVDHHKVSFFVDRALVKENEGKHFIKVQIVGSSSDKIRVLLPTEAFETASRWAEIAA